MSLDRCRAPKRFFVDVSGYAFTRCYVRQRFDGWQATSSAALSKVPGDIFVEIRRASRLSRPLKEKLRSLGRTVGAGEPVLANISAFPTMAFTDRALRKGANQAPERRPPRTPSGPRLHGANILERMPRVQQQQHWLRKVLTDKLVADRQAAPSKLPFMMAGGRTRSCSAAAVRLLLSGDRRRRLHHRDQQHVDLSSNAAATSPRNFPRVICTLPRSIAFAFAALSMTPARSRRACPQ